MFNFLPLYVNPLPYINFLSERTTLYIFQDNKFYFMHSLKQSTILCVDISTSRQVFFVNVMPGFHVIALTAEKSHSMTRS